MANKNIILVAGRDEKDEKRVMQIWFHASIVRKVVMAEQSTSEHLYISKETFPYGKHGYVMINQMWVDPKDPEAVAKATNRYSYCTVL